MSHEIKPRVETPTPTETHDIIDPYRKKSVFEKINTRAKKVGVAVIGLATLITGGLITANVLSQNEESTPEPSPTPTAEAPAVTGETTAPATEVPTSEASPSDIPTFESGEQASEAMDLETFFRSFEISADEYTTPEAISARYVDLYDQWMNAGGTVQFSWDVISNEDKTITDVMAKFDGRITDALYTDSPEAQSLVADIENGLRRFVVRDISWSVDSEGADYEIDYELVNSVLTGGSVESGVFSVQNTLHVTDNGAATIKEFRETYDIPIN